MVATLNFRGTYGLDLIRDPSEIPVRMLTFLTWDSMGRKKAFAVCITWLVSCSDNSHDIQHTQDTKVIRAMNRVEDSGTYDISGYADLSLRLEFQNFPRVPPRLKPLFYSPFHKNVGYKFDGQKKARRVFAMEEGHKACRQGKLVALSKLFREGNVRTSPPQVSER